MALRDFVRSWMVGPCCLAVAASLTLASTGVAADAPAAAATPAAAPYAAVLKDAKSSTGMLTLHQTTNNVYVELGAGDYNSEYLVLISIAKGISQGSLLGGMSWGFGDDWVWTFRKLDDKVHIVRRNVRFKATQGSPEATAVSNAYTDSVMFSLPIAMKGPKGGDLVDLTPVFMSDLPQIGQALPGFAFSQQKSTWAKVKAFPNNVELEVAATYASGGTQEIDTVADSRGVTINVHYSVSKIPTTGYQPRLADDRVGYFLTVVKDFSNKSDREQYVRYINRWDLRKADPTAAISPPVKPIKFWIEKTVPFKYRKAIYDGIYEWNKAYEKAGFANAIIVDQQPDDATWDPEDVNYNTFRWITAGAGFAMGPSRVNPYTGQILDADIIFDADFLTFWKQEYETLTPTTIAQMTNGEIAADDRAARMFMHPGDNRQCALNHGMSRQFAFASAAIFGVANADPKVAAELQEKLIMQGLKEVTMHEVGHTLGLRHNFKASKMLSLKEMQDTNKTKDIGLVASVMDYAPANIVPKEWQQGDFYSQTIGPYDYWAIEYGYKPFSGGTTGEVDELKKIAGRSGEAALAYATDEDTRAMDPDPDSNRFDMGSDALEYARTRAEIVKQLMPGIVDRMTK
ncbi:MAG TPA: zinc-dependent metalloprotease, partial [Pirellulaceae bacterium]|nr:zinc-dependent metalloprotease [Pirellulaceae bacterium]